MHTCTLFTEGSAHAKEASVCVCVYVRVHVRVHVCGASLIHNINSFTTQEYCITPNTAQY